MSFCEKVFGGVGKAIDKGVKAGQDVKIVKKVRDITGGILKTMGNIITTKEKPEEPEESKEETPGMMKPEILYLPPKAIERLIEDSPPGYRATTKALLEGILADQR